MLSVGDYFWAPYVPESAGEARPWRYGSDPVVCTVIEVTDHWVYSEYAVGKEWPNFSKEVVPTLYFPISMTLVKLTEDQALTLITAFRLTGEMPEVSHVQAR